MSSTKLTRFLKVAIILSVNLALPLISIGKTYSAADFGVFPDSVRVQTSALQAAIDSVAAREGGRLRLPKGDYVSGTINLRSRVVVCLDEGARILGSVNPYDYQGYVVGNQEGNLMADKCSVSMMALVVADGISDFGIIGHGTIDGRGLDLALAIDSLHHIGERVDPAYNTRRMRPSIRPKLFDFDGAKNGMVKDLTLKNSASWGLSLNKCSNILISGIGFENRGYWNNDGIDIADCKHVKVTDCKINSADDGIVLKSFDPADTNDDIEIENCEIRSSANALKMGTESFGGFRNVRIRNIRVRDTFRSAVALETVDGATLENVVVDGVNAQNTGNGIFMRLGHRRGEKPGSFRNVVVKNLTCTIPFGRPDEAYDLRGPDINTIHNPFPNSLTGIPGHPLENVTLENIHIHHPGRGTKGMGYIGKYRLHDVPEAIDSYPEFHMFGELPAWGFYLRHIDGLTLKNVSVCLEKPDYRDAVVTDDVINISGEITDVTE